MNWEYENPLFLEEWLKSRVKYQKEEEANIQKNKQAVKRIDFSWHNLKGKFVIADFPNLTTLNLGNNSLEEIEIKNCPHLRNIIVSHNQKRVEEEFTFVDEWENTRKYQISKEVEPTLEKLTITDCPEVRELYCSNNALADLDISQLNQLTVLSYSNNKLSESKQEELAAKKLLEGNPTGNPIKTFDNDFLIDNEEITEIDISGERGWEGKLEVKNCPKLTSLVVDNCGLEELVIEDCPNLRTLSFRFNKIDGAKEINLSGLNKLEELYCSGSRLLSLDLSKNLNLKHLVCDNNPIDFLWLKENKKLESLFCFQCDLKELNCNGLDKLEQLYCANSNIEKININGCDSLEILDCAENYLKFLNISNKKKLELVSCKENVLKKLTIKDSPNLKSVDFSRQSSEGYSTRLNINNSNNLEKIFYDEGAVVPDWKTFPNIELVRAGKDKEIEWVDKKTGVKKRDIIYSTKETDFLAQRNTSRIIKIIANPNNYSLDDLLQVDKKDLCGVSSELRKKLIELTQKKFKEKLILEENTKAQKLLDNKENHPNFLLIVYLRMLNQNLLDQETKDKVNNRLTELENKEKEPEDSGDEENPNSIPSTPPNEKPSKLPKPQDIPTPQQTPTPKENNKDETIHDLKEKIAKLQEENESLKSKGKKPDSKEVREAEKKIKRVKEEINNSKLDENKKQELLKLLEELDNKNKNINNNNEVESPSSSHNYNLVWIPVLIGEFVLLSALIYAYWCDWRKKRL